MKRLDEIILTRDMSRSLDRLTRTELHQFAARFSAYPPEARLATTDYELESLDEAALRAQLSRRALYASGQLTRGVAA